MEIEYESRQTVEMRSLPQHAFSYQKKSSSKHNQFP
jgi:hypothetical protein